MVKIDTPAFIRDTRLSPLPCGERVRVRGKQAECKKFWYACIIDFCINNGISPYY
jgi:hypothetical protein